MGRGERCPPEASLGLPRAAWPDRSGIGCPDSVSIINHVIIGLQFEHHRSHCRESGPPAASRPVSSSCSPLGCARWRSDTDMVVAVLGIGPCPAEARQDLRICPRVPPKAKHPPASNPASPFHWRGRVRSAAVRKQGHRQTLVQVANRCGQIGTLDSAGRFGR